MKRHLFLLTMMLLAGGSGCDQNNNGDQNNNADQNNNSDQNNNADQNNNDYVKTFKGDLIRREDAQNARVKDRSKPDNARWNEKETPEDDED